MYTNRSSFDLYIQTYRDLSSLCGIKTSAYRNKKPPMIEKSRKLPIVKSLLAGVLAVALIWFTAGPVLGLGWHLLHHNYVVYRGFTIPIPSRSYVTHTSIGLCIWTLSPGAPFFNRPYGSTAISKSIRPFSKDKDYSGFAEAMEQAAGRSGHKLIASRTIPLGDRSAFCLEFARGPKQPRSLMRCAIDGSDIFVSYEGDSRYLSDVFDILRSIFAPVPPARS